MSILTCARRHRSLRWSSRAQRALARRHHVCSAKRGAGAAGSAARALFPAQVAASSALALAKTPPPPPLATGLAPLSAAMSTMAHASQSKAESSAEADADPARPTSGAGADAAPPSTSWSAMFLALFAMIQPEWAKEPRPESDLLEELCITSVPPHVSEVIASADGDAFWRFDMDSYAANRLNEDRSQHVVDAITDPQTGAVTRVFFCACYDGHGGEEAVDFVQKNLYKNIRRHLAAGGETVAHAMMSGFKDTDEEFVARSQERFARGAWASCSVGACAVTALVVGETLYVASCGDCRAVMGVRDRDGSLRVEQITADHSANEEREQRRLRVLYPEDYDIVREIGCKNFYVKGRLQPTRSIGDTYMKVKDVNRAPMPRGLRIAGSFRRPYVSSVPDVFSINLRARRPEFLVLGSDGLFGELSNDEVVRLVSQFREEGAPNVSAALRAAVLDKVAAIYGTSAAEMADISPGDRRNYHDDITIDVLHFCPAPLAAAPHAAVA